MSIKHYLAIFLLSLCIISKLAYAQDTDSPYRKAGNLIFISSQVPIDPTTQQLVSNKTDAQVKQVFDNLQTQIQAVGATMNDVVKLTVYMNNMDDVFPVVKQYIPKYFKPPYPARSPMGNISFGKQTGFKLAIDAIVYLPAKKS